MSRYIEEAGIGIYKTTIASMDRCKHEYNEVCCNTDYDEVLADFCTGDRQKCCPYFEKEDGVIDDG